MVNDNIIFGLTKSPRTSVKLYNLDLQYSHRAS